MADRLALGRCGGGGGSSYAACTHRGGSLSLRCAPADGTARGSRCAAAAADCGGGGARAFPGASLRWPSRGRCVAGREKKNCRGGRRAACTSIALDERWLFDADVCRFSFGIRRGGGGGGPRRVGGAEIPDDRCGTGGFPVGGWPASLPPCTDEDARHVAGEAPGEDPVLSSATLLWDGCRRALFRPLLEAIHTSTRDWIICRCETIQRSCTLVLRKAP